MSKRNLTGKIEHVEISTSARVKQSLQILWYFFYKAYMPNLKNEIIFGNSGKKSPLSSDTMS